MSTMNHLAEVAAVMAAAERRDSQFSVSSSGSSATVFEATTTTTTSEPLSPTSLVQSCPGYRILLVPCTTCNCSSTDLPPPALQPLTPFQILGGGQGGGGGGGGSQSPGLQPLDSVFPSSNESSAQHELNDAFHEREFSSTPCIHDITSSSIHQARIKPNWERGTIEINGHEIPLSKSIRFNQHGNAATISSSTRLPLSFANTDPCTQSNYYPSTAAGGGGGGGGGGGARISVIHDREARRRSASPYHTLLPPSATYSPKMSGITAAAASSESGTPDSDRKYICPFYGHAKQKRHRSFYPSPLDYQPPMEEESVCTARFRRKQEMERHVLSVHGTDEEKGWMCPGTVQQPCGKRYARADALRKHLDSAKCKTVEGGCSFGLSEGEVAALIKAAKVDKKV
ncbi:hypothetical protein BDR26DRAFT_860676 [Obelidium mucronatum]|nr:hypothetical protein BDR26DRAFT_860676 [Obelidium mucronatum]